MNLVIITLAHADPDWFWSAVRPVHSLRLQPGTPPHLDPKDFPPEVTLERRNVQADAHQIVQWQFSRLHKDEGKSGSVTSEILRRCQLIYDAVCVHTPCLSNDAVVGHGSRFPDGVVSKRHSCVVRYNYYGEIDIFGRAAAEGLVNNSVFRVFVDEVLRGKMSLETFRQQYPGIISG